MTSFRRFAIALLAILPTLRAADEEGWTPLFNGRDLSNWVNVNCAPETWTVADGVIKCTGKPTGAMRTKRMYENFIMEVEWRHMKAGGNAGIFIWAGPISAPGVPFLRAIEVQVLDHGHGEGESFTTHGDVFPIHGSKMVPFGRHRGMRSFPSEKRSKPSPEWNHYRIEARDGVLRLSVNGKEVSGGEKCVWRKGYIALESEGGPVEWRNLKVKELPGGSATAAETADVARGHRSLYNGADLRGWKTESPGRWEAADWQLVQKAGDAAKPLWTDADFGDAEFVLDCNRTKDARPAVTLRGLTIPLPGAAGWSRTTLTVKGREVVVQSGTEMILHKLADDAPVRGPLGIVDIGGGVRFASLYVLEPKPAGQ
jgi:Domain of Unknown Function (DUF1080)